MPIPKSLDDVVRSADPIAAVALETPAMNVALNDLGQQLMEMPQVVPTKRSRESKAWRTRPVVTMGGPGELLRTWAPDFCQVALAASADINFPPGYQDWRLQVLAFENQIPDPSATGDCPVTPPGGTPKSQQGYVSTGAERGWFAMSAFCAWVSDYQSASASGNASEAATASSEVVGATSWPAVLAENSSTFDFFGPFQSAVAAGNTTRVTQMLNQPHNACAGFVPPS